MNKILEYHSRTMPTPWRDLGWRDNQQMSLSCIILCCPSAGFKAVEYSSSVYWSHLFMYGNDTFHLLCRCHPLCRIHSTSRSMRLHNEDISSARGYKVWQNIYTKHSITTKGKPREQHIFILSSSQPKMGVLLSLVSNSFMDVGNLNDTACYALGLL